MSKICQLESVVKEEKESYSRQLDEALLAKQNLKKCVGELREEAMKKDQLLAQLSEEVQLLREERDGLKDVVSDLKEGRFERQVKIASNIDVLLKKYVEIFPQDESDITSKFVDRVSQHSSLAFHLLLKLCHEDAISNIRLLAGIIPSAESMIDVVVHHKLFVEMCRYARIVQCRNAGMFEEASTASSKSKELTRHKINYEEVELVNARQQFVLVVLKVLRKMPSRSSHTSTKRSQSDWANNSNFQCQ